MTAWIASALAMTLAMGGSHALVLSASPLNATLQDSSRERGSLSKWRGKPIILFYEDKNSTLLNLALKEELAERDKQQRLLEEARQMALSFFNTLAWLTGTELGTEPQP
jgi:hypothetical protein